MMNCGGEKGCGAKKLGMVLLLIGGLNWGLMGLGALLGNKLADWNVVAMIVGSYPPVESIVYLLVGLSAVMMIVGCRCSTCSSEGKM